MWQRAWVSVTPGRAGPALHHARRCLELWQDNGSSDWDLAAAWDLVCRASLVAGDATGAQQAPTGGTSALEDIREAEGRRPIETELDELAHCLAV